MPLRRLPDSGCYGEASTKEEGRMRFQAMRMNHKWTVVDNETKQIVDEFHTQTAADTDANARNLDAWRQARPESVATFEGAATGDDLVELIDRIYEPEIKLELLAVGLKRVA